MPGPETLLTVRRDAPRLGEEVLGALREAIGSGRIVAGSRLPSSRDLAADLGVSRGVVVNAYEQLTAEGLLTSRRGAGTTVATRPASALGRRDAAGLGSAAGPVRPIPPLRPGTPDPGLFPRSAWRNAYHDALAALPDAGLGYGDPAGLPELRVALAAYLGRVRAARVDPASIIVTTGASQAIALVAAALRDAGETHIGIEDPGSSAIRQHLRTHGLEPVPVPVDRDGIDVAYLSRTTVRSVLVTPAHQFPVGCVLAPHRRAALVDWARNSGALIIEDDYDAEIRYDRDPVGAVQYLGPDVVALAGTVSKALAPALRLGWVSLPEPWLTRVAELKAAADGGGPALEHAAFARFLESGAYDRHLRKARRVYRARRDATVAALAAHLPEVRISGVAAGLHLVAELPDDHDDQAIVADAERAGLGPLALSAARARPGGAPGLLIGYGAHPSDEQAAAIRTLAGIIHGS